MIRALLHYSFEVQFLSKERSIESKIHAEFPGLDLIMYDDSMDDPSVRNALIQYAPDYLFVCSLDEKVPTDICRIPTVMAINFHPSLLPYFRGPNPYYWMIKLQSKDSGLTAHQITQDWDAGDIIYQHSFLIDQIDTSFTLFQKTCEHIHLMIRDMTPLLMSRNLSLEKQGAGTYFSQIPTEDYTIDWTHTVDDIDSLVRALTFPTFALALVNGDVIKIIEAKPTRHSSPHSHDIVMDNGVLLIGANDYYLDVQVLMYRDSIYSAQRFLQLKGYFS